ncbi:MAG: MmcQ/YjbR family DNA-binding protein [Actinomycetota bacterium]|nr:MmcQ/YjbR family DNA-binding protein [Actinomycetota bacterium]
MASEDDAREIALSLPETIEKPSYGMPGFRVKDRLFARIREERDVLVVWREGLDEKELLIAAEPDKFFTTPHYDGYAIVLVRLGAVDREELTELVTESWRLRAPKRLVARFDGEG